MVDGAHRSCSDQAEFVYLSLWIGAHVLGIPTLLLTCGSCSGGPYEWGSKMLGLKRGIADGQAQAPGENEELGGGGFVVVLLAA